MNCMHLTAWVLPANKRGIQLNNAFDPKEPLRTLGS
jgi:hypothetical protein